MIHCIRHHSGYSFVCLVFLIIFGIQCSTKDQKETAARRTRQNTEMHEPGSGSSSSLDSLKSLLDLADHDTSRLKLLDEMAEVFPDSETVSDILFRMDSIIDANLVPDPADEEKNTCQKYRAATLYR